MEQQPKTREINGYIYGPGTAQGFQRMKRQGIPRPVFAVEDKMRRFLKRQYARIVRKLLNDLRTKAAEAGLKVKSGKLTTDGPEEDNLKALMDFFDEMKAQEEAAQDAIKKANLKAQLASVSNNLQAEWNSEPEPEQEDLSAELYKILKQNMETFSERLKNDAGGKFGGVIQSFSIDKDKLYGDHMEALRRLYLDNSLERIKGEEDWLKRQLLNQINDYVTGASDELDLTDVTNALLNNGERMSQFFARDQLARLNKATTLATFQDAGVTKVKWVTSHDLRVRATHKALDGKVFEITALPKEVDDYNCRCGLIPVEYEN